MKPLIDGEETYAAMEKAIAASTSTVHFAGWIFSPATQLQALQAVNAILAKRGVRGRVGTWAELLTAVAKLGSNVRIVLTDFDPILQNKNHASNWAAYFSLRSAAVRAPPGKFEVMVSMHEARISVGVSDFAAPRLAQLLKRINSQGKVAAAQKITTMPRLWRFIRRNSTTGLFEPSPSASLFICPASHHQKILIVDRIHGFCGGLDVNKGRISNQTHTTRLWHDADVAVDGQLAADLDRNFLGRWNQEGRDFNSFISLSDPGGRALPAIPVAIPVPVPSSAVPAGSGPAVAQLWRTLSKNGLLTPTTNLRADVEEGFERSITNAEHFVYIENQYVRDPQIAEWLIERRVKVPDLVVILVVPIAPEEVSDSEGVDPITAKGLLLQKAIINDLALNFKTNFGVFSMISREATSLKPAKVATITSGSLQIYVHNKTMIIDDVWAMVGSANANPRSFRIDTEANIAWFDPKSVRRYRKRLWTELLGPTVDFEKWAPSDFVSNWNAIASKNSSLREPKDVRRRSGFIVPHDAERFAKPHPGAEAVPEEFTELVDTDPEQLIIA